LSVNDKYQHNDHSRPLPMFPFLYAQVGDARTFLIAPSFVFFLLFLFLASTIVCTGVGGGQRNVSTLFLGSRRTPHCDFQPVHGLGLMPNPAGMKIASFGCASRLTP
jgi:hypothetical protein